MHVKTLSAESFRNFQRLQVHFNEGINIIHGDNAQGKTNLLEALYFCASGRSIRATADEELIRFGENTAHVQTTFTRGTGPSCINAYLQRQGTKTIKHLSIDRVPIKKWNDLLGRLLVVNFAPEDLRLIKAGPAERRAFMDAEICQLSPVYCNELRGYQRALKQRNHLMKILQKNRAGNDGQVDLWDTQLCKLGRRVMRFRASFVSDINEMTQEIHKNITGGAENLFMEYKPNIENAGEYEAILKNRYLRDVAMGTTTRGVHKDDIYFEINGVPARVYGSQGQQRTAALSVKLAEIDIVRQSVGTPPVLLLDDVLSELDEHRQRFLMKQIGGIQTLLTCTGVEDVLRNAGHDGLNIMRMVNGEVS
jgi:DNA replication and repair protein RecF